MKVRVITDLKGLAELAHTWAGWQNHPFADMEFFSLFAESMPSVEHPCVLVLTAGETPIALWAGRVETSRDSVKFGYLSVFSANVRRLSFPTGGLLGDDTPEVSLMMLKAIQRLLSEERLDYAVINNVHESSSLFPALPSLGPGVGRDLTHTESRHWAMSLDGGLPGFLARRSRKGRHWLTRLPRVLERDFPGGAETKVFSAENDVDVFCAEAESVAALTYQRQLGSGLVDDDFTRRRYRLFARRGLFLGLILYVAGKPKAFWVCTVYHDKLFVDATGYDPALRKYEIGTVLFMSMIDEAFRRGLKAADFGLGTAAYKERFGDQSWSDRTVRVYARTPKAILLNHTQAVVTSTTDWLKKRLGGPRLTQMKTQWRRRLVRGEAADRRQEQSEPST
jgi:hypothetical protein